MAESEGFEPSNQLPSYLLSREALSTTQPTLRIKRRCIVATVPGFCFLNSSKFTCLCHEVMSRGVKSPKLKQCVKSSMLNPHPQ